MSESKSKEKRTAKSNKTLYVFISIVGILFAISALTYSGISYRNTQITKHDKLEQQLLEQTRINNELETKAIIEETKIPDETQPTTVIPSQTQVSVPKKEPTCDRVAASAAYDKWSRDYSAASDLYFSENTAINKKWQNEVYFGATPEIQEAARVSREEEKTQNQSRYYKQKELLDSYYKIATEAANCFF
jgi:cytoskeletal protein RodZ